MTASELSGDDDQFLSWFSDLGIPMLEFKLQLGALEYFHFASSFRLADGREVSSFGSALDRKSAALKCAGEAIERQAMAEYFIKSGEKYPKPFRNSNGWAVHTSLAKAELSAQNEAIERHLLFKSFFKFGWSGFNYIQDITGGDLQLRLLTTRYVSHGLIAGMVAAQSPRFAGVSFGYTVGKIEDANNASFWQQAIFEAADKFLMLNGKELEPAAGDSWIKKQIATYMNNPFDLEELKQPVRDLIEETTCLMETWSFDLSRERKLGFSLHAAFASGEKLIPLFSKTELDERGADAIARILSQNGISDVPERHPIL